MSAYTLTMTLTAGFFAVAGIYLYLFNRQLLGVERCVIDAVHCPGKPSMMPR
jgi:hypothetical protein